MGIKRLTLAYSILLTSAFLFLFNNTSYSGVSLDPLFYWNMNTFPANNAFISPQIGVSTITCRDSSGHFASTTGYTGNGVMLTTGWSSEEFSISSANINMDKGVIECWSTSSGHGLFYSSGPSTTNAYTFVGSNPPYPLEFFIDGAHVQTDAQTNWFTKPFGSWYNYRFVWDRLAGVLEIWVDGVKRSSNITGTWAPATIDRFTIMGKVGRTYGFSTGRALDEFDKEGWKGIGRLLGRIHLISKHREKSNRIVWRPNTATSHHLDILVGTKAILPDFENSFLSASRAFIDFAEKRFSETEPVSILIHGDCHRGNFIHRPGEGVYLVDFDDICQGPPVQDLWMLLPDTVEKSQNELSWFFEGYETFNQFDRASLELIPILRGMRLIHFASWCAIQKDEPHFDQHFHDWGSKRYWNELIKDLNGIIYAPDEE